MLFMLKEKAIINDGFLLSSPTCPELNPLYDSLKKIYDLSQILKENGPIDQ